MQKLDIIYEDKDIIVVNKPSGLLTIASSQDKIHTLYSETSYYVKKQYPKNKIFIVHRLDKDTSGIILFAKSEKVKRILQDNWANFTKEYIAIVEGIMPKLKDRLVNYLRETKTYLVYVTNNPKNSKLAITNYEVIKSNKKYSLLKILIETGRKNQIRAQLSYLGNPIVGDKKYNAKTNPLKRLGLHASRLVITHPITNKELEFLAKVPKNFDNLL